MNSIKAEWVENRFWVYKTTFTVPEEHKGQKIILVFEGIDYTAHIYVNNKELAVHTGMFVPCKLDISAFIAYGEPNKLRVVIEQAPNEYGQIGYTSKTTTQKARFGYKWDFSTRLVNLGLYGNAYIEVFDGAHIADTHIRYRDGKVFAAVTLGDVKAACEADVTLSYQGEPVAHTTVTFSDREVQTAVLAVEKPKLWYPNGYGAQPLYDLTVRITENGKETDCRSYSVGVRILDADGKEVKTLHTSLQTRPDRTVKALSFDLPVKDFTGHFTVECTLETDGKHDKNVYLLFVKDEKHPHCAVLPVLAFMKQYFAEESF